MFFWLPTLIALWSYGRIGNLTLRCAFISPVFPEVLNRVSKWFVRQLLDWTNDFIEEIGGIEMKILGLRPGEVLETTLELQKSEKAKDRTTFLYTSLDASDYARIQNELYQVDGWGKNRRERFLTGTQQVEVMKLGLKGWKNFKYEDGTDVAWEEPSKGKNAQEVDNIMMNNINRIPPEARAELVDIIRGESTVSQD